MIVYTDAKIYRTFLKKNSYILDICSMDRKKRKKFVQIFVLESLFSLARISDEKSVMINGVRRTLRVLVTYLCVCCMNLRVTITVHNHRTICP